MSSVPRMITCSNGIISSLGYYKNPDANSETFDEDGWMISGDIAFYDDEECFYIVDRLKEFIKVKAFQVCILTLLIF